MKLFLLCAALINIIPIMATADPISDDPRVLRLLEVFQKQCDEEQGAFRDIDSDLDAPLIGKLDLGKDNIYEVEIGHVDAPEKVTIIYPEFRCENIGYGWCGSGGCGFYVLTKDKMFQSWLGFAPEIVSLETATTPQNVLVSYVSGGNCEDASGGSGAGMDPCISVAAWSEQKRTFFTYDGRLREWDFPE